MNTAPKPTSDESSLKNLDPEDVTRYLHTNNPNEKFPFTPEEAHVYCMEKLVKEPSLQNIAEVLSSRHKKTKSKEEIDTLNRSVLSISPNTQSFSDTYKGWEQGIYDLAAMERFCHQQSIPLAIGKSDTAFIGEVVSFISQELETYKRDTAGIHKFADNFLRENSVTDIESENKELNKAFEHLVENPNYTNFTTLVARKLRVSHFNEDMNTTKEQKNKLRNLGKLYYDLLIFPDTYEEAFHSAISAPLANPLDNQLAKPETAIGMDWATAERYLNSDFYGLLEINDEIHTRIQNHLKVEKNLPKLKAFINSPYSTNTLIQRLINSSTGEI